MKHYYNEKYYENIELSYKIQAFDFVAYNKAIKVKLTKEQEEIAIKAANTIGLSWAGVDIIEDKKQNSYVLEVNYSSGVAGIEETTGINISKNVIEFVTNTENWIKPSSARIVR